MGLKTIDGFAILVTPKPTFDKIEEFLEREKTNIYKGKFEFEKKEGFGKIEFVRLILEIL